MKILAANLQIGDVWLGDDTELVIDRILPAVQMKFIPWGKGANHPPHSMRAVTVSGDLYSRGERPYHGIWHLQPDMPVEVRRPPGKSKPRTPRPAPG